MVAVEKIGMFSGKTFVELRHSSQDAVLKIEQQVSR